MVSSGYMSSSGIGGSYGGFITSFLRNLHTVLKVAGSICIPNQECKKFPFSPTPSLAFSVCRFFDDGNSDKCEVILIVVLICISLIMSKVEHLFMCLLAIGMSSLEKYLFRSSAHFWLCCLFFWMSVVSFAIIFSHSEDYLFHLVYSFLCCAKSFKFKQIPFVNFCFYFHYSRRWVIEDLTVIYVRMFCLCLPLNMFSSKPFILVLYLGL